MTTRLAESSLTYQARPTVRIEQNALPDLSNQELLALLIGGGYATSDAGLLLEAIGGNLKLLYTATLDELAGHYSGVGYATAKRLKAALELGRRLVTPEPQGQFTSPHASADYFTRHGLPLCDQEELWVAVLDTKNRPISLAKVYRGNLNSLIVRNGEVFREAIRHNAAAIVTGLKSGYIINREWRYTSLLEAIKLIQNSPHPSQKTGHCRTITPKKQE